MAEKQSVMTVAAAAIALKVSARQVRNLIAAGVLPAQKLGRDYIISASDLSRVPKIRKPGRPKGK